MLSYIIANNFVILYNDNYRKKKDKFLLYLKPNILFMYFIRT